MSPTDVTATYRLQLHAGFTLEHAREVVPYLAALGVSHVYLSPVLTAVPGSQHGYDVLDHGSIDSELGGRDALERLAADCHRAGLGVVVDSVPNHMALTAPEWANRQVWEVLRRGRQAATAHWFDVDWDALGGRFGLPILGAPLEQVLADGQLVLDTGRPEEGPAAGESVIRYFEHVLPVAGGTTGPSAGAHSDRDLADVLSRQHFLLAHWRDAEATLNYRRFFEVDSLIGVRVEESDVFEDTHRLLLDLHHSGVIDGFRIDHPDGLTDPEAYLRRLTRQCRPGTPIWVEKILEGPERLPQTWECAGTTGYDAQAVLQRALVPERTAETIDAAWSATGGQPSLAAVVEEAKQQAVDTLLTPETARLLRRAHEALPDEDSVALASALRALLVAVDVYRAYVRPGRDTAPEAEAHLVGAIEQAAGTSGQPDVVQRLGEVLLRPDGSADRAAARDLAVRFQQVTGPVMAKGIEDTAFYRWHRLVALNEVGADPAAPPGTESLTTWARHQVDHWPRGMTTLSTHDTKRSEDVRARLLAVAADAAAWRECSEAFAGAASEHGVDGPTAHLLWQTVVGAAGDPEAGHGLEQERLEAYLVKAMREGKEHTHWIAVDQAYEERVLSLARAALADGPLREVTDRALVANRGRVRVVILAQKLLQLTLPGVPDTYQGCELVDLSLVDPDNRRPVDFADRAARLDRLDAGGTAVDLSDEKLLITAATLRLRRQRPVSFAGDFTLLETGTSLLGYRRGEDVVVLAGRAPEADGTLPPTQVALPAGVWVDRFTGTRHEGSVSTGAVLATLPVALLAREEHDRG
ncbi:malto-oligosyltrehalose synthase [Ornithinimicrobium murale]|uniref:malto-oligosyltrehalose synthase n=1 Tax=Ornithinimicrobium murale TaxID=1050153 RepID=UPI000E0CD304|nr:malto-oligosyltrehalose synthase [Ornithinimicrobium murale]